MKKIIACAILTGTLAVSIHFCNLDRLVPYIYIHRLNNSEEYEVLSKQTAILEANDIQYKAVEKEDAIVISIPANRRIDFDVIMAEYFDQGLTL